MKDKTDEMTEQLLHQKMFKGESTTDIVDGGGILKMKTMVKDDYL